MRNRLGSKAKRAVLFLLATVFVLSFFAVPIFAIPSAYAAANFYDQVTIGPDGKLLPDNKISYTLPDGWQEVANGAEAKKYEAGGGVAAKTFLSTKNQNEKMYLLREMKGQNNIVEFKGAWYDYMEAGKLSNITESWGLLNPASADPIQSRRKIDQRLYNILTGRGIITYYEDANINNKYYLNKKNHGSGMVTASSKDQRIATVHFTNGPWLYKLSYVTTQNLDNPVPAAVTQFINSLRIWDYEDERDTMVKQWVAQIAQGAQDYDCILSEFASVTALTETPIKELYDGWALKYNSEILPKGKTNYLALYSGFVFLGEDAILKKYYPNEKKPSRLKSVEILQKDLFTPLDYGAVAFNWTSTVTSLKLDEACVINPNDPVCQIVTETTRPVTWGEVCNVEPSFPDCWRGKVEIKYEVEDSEGKTYEFTSSGGWLDTIRGCQMKMGISDPYQYGDNGGYPKADISAVIRCIGDNYCEQTKFSTVQTTPTQPSAPAPHRCPYQCF